MQGKIINALNKVIELSIYCMVFIIPFSKTAIEIFATIAIISWLIKQAVSHGLEIRLYFPKTPLTRPVFALFGVWLISAVFSTDINLSLKGLFSKLVEYILLFFICIDTFSSEERKQEKSIMLFGMVFLSAVLLFADGLVQWVWGKDFIRGYKRIGLKACFNSSNGFGGYIIAILPVLFCMSFLRFKKRQNHNPAARTWIKIIAGSAIKFSGIPLYFAGLILLYKTFSRGAWLGYIVSMAFSAIMAGFIIGNKTKRGKGVVFLTMLCVLIPLMAAVIFVKPVRERLTGIKAGFAASVSRLHLWKEAAAIIEDFPILGAGPNTYSTIIPKYSISRVTGTYPHNSFLQMAAEAGILGLMVFLLVLWRFFYNGLKLLWQSAPPDDSEQNRRILLLGIIAGVSATLAHSFFDTNFFTLQLAALLWVMLGVGTACIISVPAK